jgi:PPM family protein phosphatase
MMHVAAQSDPGCLRTTYEDCAWVNAALGLLIVADGMGGHAAGEVASAVAVEAIATYVQNHLPTGEASAQPAALLQEALQTANATIRTQARTHRSFRGMGTTVVLALCHGAWVHLAHVGDSRAYLFHQGVLRQVTQDHTVVAQLLQAGQLTPRQARRHPLRHQLTRWLGGREVVPEVQSVPWQPGDRLLLCSDGLTTMVADRHIAALLRPRGTDLHAVCTALVARANAQGGEDNISVILAQRDTEGNADG